MKTIPWQHRNLSREGLLALSRDYERLANRHAQAGRFDLANDADWWAQIYASAADDVGLRSAA
jgi:hypothetical protein